MASACAQPTGTGPLVDVHLRRRSRTLRLAARLAIPVVDVEIVGGKLAFIAACAEPAPSTATTTSTSFRPRQSRSFRGGGPPTFDGRTGSDGRGRISRKPSQSPLEEIGVGGVSSTGGHGVRADAGNLGLEVGDDVAAAGFPGGETGDHGGEGVGGVHVAEGGDGGDVDGGGVGGRGETGGDEVGVDGGCDEGFEVGGGGDGEGGHEVGVGERGLRGCG